MYRQLLGLGLFISTFLPVFPLTFIYVLKHFSNPFTCKGYFAVYFYGRHIEFVL